MPPSDLNAMDEDISVQAADWCMRLHDDDCPPAVRQDFQRWIEVDPRHAFEYAKMLEIWDLSGQLPDEPETAKKLLTAHGVAPERKREI
jgi:transmembrane sensor